MDVFIIPIGRDGYELYCEPSVDADAGEEGDSAPGSGMFGRLRYRFGAVLRAVEERQHRGRESGAGGDDTDAKSGRFKDVRDRVLGWVAQRITEQRLLWNLRRRRSAVAKHPQDMPFEQVLTFIRRTLRRDYERHRLWLVVNAVGLVASGPLALVPGPNVLAYYFAFRAVGHWLSMRGAAQGLHRVSWVGRECPPLAELRDVAMLEPPVRDARILDVATRLRLQHLTTFFERVALRHA